MSEKFMNGWRKSRDTLIFSSSMLLVIFAFLFIVFLFVSAVIDGVIASILWNVAMPTMFGFSKVAIFQASVLVVTAGSLRSGYFRNIRSEYAVTKAELYKVLKDEKTANVVSALFMITLNLIYMLIAICGTRYSWNKILPQLLNVELNKIGFWQSVAFAWLVNLLFGKANCTESKAYKTYKNFTDKNTKSKAKDYYEEDEEDFIE